MYYTKSAMSKMYSNYFSEQTVNFHDVFSIAVPQS